MNIKKYEINYNMQAEIHIEVDHDIMTDEALHEINNFWSDAKSRLSNSETVLEAVLKHLAQVVFYIQYSNDYNIFGVVDEFDYSKPMLGVEGWPKMDGTEGFKITRVNTFLFDPSDITISEVA